MTRGFPTLHATGERHRPTMGRTGRDTLANTAIPAGTPQIRSEVRLVGGRPVLTAIAAVSNSLGADLNHNNNGSGDRDDASTLRRRMEFWEASIRLTPLGLAVERTVGRPRLEAHALPGAATLRGEPPTGGATTPVSRGRAGHTNKTVRSQPGSCRTRAMRGRGTPVWRRAGTP